MGKFTKTAKRVMFHTTQESLQHAVLADFVDIIPIVGDVGNAIKIVNAAKKGDTTALVLQTGDLVVGIVPVIGAIGDFLTPTNTLIFILRNKKFRKKIEKYKPKKSWFMKGWFKKWG